LRLYHISFEPFRFSEEHYTVFLGYVVEACLAHHFPFGTKDAYIKEIMAPDLDKLAGLVRICGFLMQTIAYLFWGSTNK
jgi:hypothetical protein